MARSTQLNKEKILSDGFDCVNNRYFYYPRKRKIGIGISGQLVKCHDVCMASQGKLDERYRENDKLGKNWVCSIFFHSPKYD